MATALQLGLVSGFALQDGDKLAQLLGGGAGGGGSLGLGNTTSPNMDLTGSSNNSATGAQQITSSVTVVRTATATGNSLILPEIPVAAFCRVFNLTTVAIYIFPPTGQTLDGGPASGGVQLSPDARCDYMYVGLGAWLSDLLGDSSS